MKLLVLDLVGRRVLSGLAVAALVATVFVGTAAADDTASAGNGGTSSAAANGGSVGMGDSNSGDSSGSTVGVADLGADIEDIVAAAIAAALGG